MEERFLEKTEFENYKVKNIKDYIKTENGEKVITFEYKNGLWVCENCDKAIVFDLKGYLFKKSFITAFVIRQIRYATIRNRRAEILLYKMKNEEPKFKSTNLYLQFVLDKKVEKQQIIKNGISKNTFLSYIITNLKIIFFPQKSIAYMKNTIAVCADEEHYRK